MGHGLVWSLIPLLIAIFYGRLCFALPYLPLLRKNRWRRLARLLVWLIMNRIVLPLTKIHMAPFQWGAALIGIAILMVCIGLPIAYITDAYYKKRDVEAGSLELATASSSGGEQGARAGS